MITKLVHCRTDFVIVYCSPKRLMKPLYTRNEEALKTSALNRGRSEALPLAQYSVVYEKTNHSSFAIDRISLANTEIPENLSKMCKALLDFIFKEIVSPHDIYNEKEWQETQHMIRETFGLNADTDKTYIKPKCDYQLLVHTGEESLTICLEKILKGLKFKYYLRYTIS